MERQFEKIYLKVESEGLFDENKTPLPREYFRVLKDVT